MGNKSAIMNRLDKIEKNAGLDKRLAALAAQGSYANWLLVFLQAG
jgi:hypothetical protein